MPTRSALALILLLVSAAAASASTVANIGPIADVDRIAVEPIYIGDHLAPEHEDARPLDYAAMDAPLKAVHAEMLKELEKDGLRIVSDAEAQATIMVLLYGGKFKAAGDDPPNFVEVEIAVARDDDCSSGPWATKLVVARDAQLVGIIRDVVMAKLREFLDARKSYRERHPREGAH